MPDVQPLEVPDNLITVLRNEIPEDGQARLFVSPADREQVWIDLEVLEGGISTRHMRVVTKPEFIDAIAERLELKVVR